MGIGALHRCPRTTKPEAGHKIYPYLLRGMEITRPNQVWRWNHLHPDGAWLRLSGLGARMVSLGVEFSLIVGTENSLAGA